MASVGISRNRSVVERPPLGLPCSITRGHSRLKWYFIQTFCPSENKQGIKNVNITYFILARCEWFFKALFWICVNKLSSLKQNGQNGQSKKLNQSFYFYLLIIFPELVALKVVTFDHRHWTLRFWDVQAKVVDSNFIIHREWKNLKPRF